MRWISVYCGWAAMLAVPVGLLVFLAAYLRGARGKRLWLLAALGAYLGALVEITAIRDWQASLAGLLAPHGTESISLVPFDSLRGAWAAGPWTFAVQLAGNLLWFVPLGALLPRISEKCVRLRRVALAAFCVSLGIEVLQWALQSGVSDVDDLLLNTLGAILGFSLPFLKKR